MTDYTAIFIRTALGQDNSLPRTDTETTSPDVISSGTSQETNPESAYGSTYDQMVGAKVVYGSENFIYIRGKNYAKGQLIANAALYWSYETQLSNPSSWTQLQTVDGANSTALGAGSGDIAVTSTPFSWSPDEPTSGNPYVLIGVIYDNANPNPVPKYQKDPLSPSFDTWNAKQGGVAGHKVAAPKPPVKKSTYSLNALLSLGNTGDETLNFSLAITGGVVGDLVSCIVDHADLSGHPIGLENFKLTSVDQTTGFNATVGPDFHATVSFSYAAADEDNPPAPKMGLMIGNVQNSGGGGGGNPFDPNHGNQGVTEIASYEMTTKLAS